jgi:hypothetical protein
MAGKTREGEARDRTRDLAGKYRKIGITAVAAAVEYQGARSNSLRRGDDGERARSSRASRAGAKPRGGT